MTLSQVDFPEKVSEKIKELSKKWNLNKPQTIIKIVEDFAEAE